MFCPGTSNLPDGRLLVNGGIDSGKTSIYNPTTNTWSVAATMNIARGYQANCVLEDGSVFTLGGSWSGGVGNKHGEVWTEAAGWKRLSGVPITPMLSNDPSRNFGGDSHFWLFPAPNGRVFHAGPGVNMHWIGTQGAGSVSVIGPRGDDQFSVNGNAVMYDIGKILKTGGGPAYEGVNANANSYVIDINNGAQVRKIAPMAYARVFHNSVVLPNGQVVIVGGQTYANAFTDNNAVLRPELFDPVTETFTLLPPIAVGRNYHSVALLLPDARVMSAGGGLCGGCAANHPDLQILTPHYLLNADGSPATRPVIVSAPSSAIHGTRISVSTDSAVTAFSLVRLSSTTHAVNNDQRRVPLSIASSSGNDYQLAIPSNPGVVLPGFYMLFAMNADGVPSVAAMVQVSGAGAPKIVNPGDQSNLQNAALSLPISATGAISFAATGLPPGVSIDSTNGTFNGIPNQAGRFAVTLSAINAVATTSTAFAWSVNEPVVGVQYVRLEALTEVAGNPWASMAEFNLLDTSGALIDRTGWTVTANSVETVGENGAAINAIDGSATSFWHTQWQAASPPHPHAFTVNLGVSRTPGGFRYLPRAGGGNGTIGLWRFYTSVDGVNWVQVAQGNFADAGDNASEKTVQFSTALPPNRAPSLAPIATQNSITGQATSLSLSASDPDGDAISYAVDGLPTGLALNGAAGLISGTPSASGSFNVSVQASDGRGGMADRAFVWSVTAPALTLDPVLAPPAAAGSTVAFSVNSSGGSGLRYRWNFGDGSQDTAESTSPAVSYTYAAPGLYAVSVTVTDAGGAVKVQSFMQAIYAPVAGPTVPSHSSNVVFEARAGANARVWLVNQDNDSVSVFDAAMATRLAEIAVGTAPRSVAVAPDGRVWVTNKGSASISVINAATLAVVQTITLPRASMPFGLVFAPNGSAAFVALEASGQVLRLDPASGAALGSQNVGANPRHLSMPATSDRLLVSRFVSPPLPGEGTASVQTETAGGTKLGGELLVLDAQTLSIDRTIVLEHSGREDSTVQGRGIPNYLAAAVISPSGASAWVPSKQDNVKRGSLRDGSNLDFQNTVRAITSRIDMGTLAEDTGSRVDHDNASQASAAVFHPTGSYLFVALQTSRSIAVVDPVSRQQIMRFDAGRAPDGLAMSTDGLRLYVNNFMDRTLGVFDLSRLVNFGEAVVPPVAAVAAVSTEKLTATVLRGKQFFYDARDPRLSRDAYMSCASCHNDGSHDGRVWDLTGLGEGLRNTISLRGRGGAQGFLHWSNNFNEVQDFEGQIRGLAGGTGLMTDAQFNNGTTSQPLGTAKAGVSSDLDALAAYVASLNAFDASPNRPSASTLSANASAGKAVFTSMNCASCHGGAAFTNSGANTLSNIGTVKPSSGQRLGAALSGIDVPTLRDVWVTAPYLHDGSAATLEAAVRAHNNVSISDSNLANLVAYLREIGGEEGVAPSSVGTGLVGSYFNNITLSGTAALVRTEAVNFNWGSGSPAAGVNTNNFSARWSGTVAPATSGIYRFQTNSDDGVRVWVNGVQVINNWTDHAPTLNTSSNVSLNAGQRYNIVVEYYEKGGGAVMQLRWRVPGATSYVAIPVGSLYSN